MKYFVRCLGGLTDVRQSSIIQLLRFSGNRHSGGEEKKVLCFRKNIYISKKQPELNKNSTLKIIIFRYFAFFFRINFLFFIIYSFYILSFLCTACFSYAHVYRAYRALRP